MNLGLGSHQRRQEIPRRFSVHGPGSIVSTLSPTPQAWMLAAQAMEQVRIQPRLTAQEDDQLQVVQALQFLDRGEG